MAGGGDGLQRPGKEPPPGQEPGEPPSPPDEAPPPGPDEPDLPTPVKLARRFGAVGRGAALASWRGLNGIGAAGTAHPRATLRLRSLPGGQC